MTVWKGTPAPWRYIAGIIYAPHCQVAQMSIAHKSTAEMDANTKAISAVPQFIAFAEWCIGPRFDSRDLGIRAREALKAAGVEL